MIRKSGARRPNRRSAYLWREAGSMASKAPRSKMTLKGEMPRCCCRRAGLRAKTSQQKTVKTPSELCVERC
jgi:hypothetical protein